MNTPLVFGISVAGDQRTFTVEGELAASPHFGRALLAAVAETRPGGELVVDLRGVQFFDVSALRALLRAADAAQVLGISLRLTASPQVDRVFENLESDTPHPARCSTRAVSPNWRNTTRAGT